MDHFVDFDRDLQSLERFVYALNTSEERFRVSSPNGRKVLVVNQTERQAELDRLVAAWRDSGPNLIKLFAAESQLRKAAQKISTEIQPTSTGRARLVPTTAPQSVSTKHKHFMAYWFFLSFLINPFNESLGGPCIYCGNFWVKKTKRGNMSYCSTKCGARATSREANRRRREEERSEKLNDVTKAIDRWRGTKTKATWKDFVAKRGEVTKKWLTRAVTRGDIVEPTKSRSL